METKSYAVDAANNKIYKEDWVFYVNKTYRVLDFQYLPRSYDIQYLKLMDINNERKILEFVDSAQTLKARKS